MLEMNWNNADADIDVDGAVQCNAIKRVEMDIRVVLSQENRKESTRLRHKEQVPTTQM